MRQREVGLDESTHAVVAFRRAFGAIWLTYDALDLWFRGTSTAAHWTSKFEPAACWLICLQCGLMAMEAALVLGKWPRMALVGCVVLRGAEAVFALHLNDFYYYLVTALLLALAPIGASARPRRGWEAQTVRTALLWQLAWIYFATATLKLSPLWLSGGHLFVRHRYLAQVFAWPYPLPLRRCFESLACEAVLAKGAIVSEYALSLLLMVRRFRALALALAFAVHAFAAVTANVWFFGLSLMVEMGILFPRNAGAR